MQFTYLILVNSVMLFANYYFNFSNNRSLLIYSNSQKIIYNPNNFSILAYFNLFSLIIGIVCFTLFLWQSNRDKIYYKINLFLICISSFLLIVNFATSEINRFAGIIDTINSPRMIEHFQPNSFFLIGAVCGVTNIVIILNQKRQKQSN